MNDVKKPAIYELVFLFYNVHSCLLNLIPAIDSKL